MSLSIWEKESLYSPSDVLVVGSGLLGLWTAIELKIKRPALKVKLIDRFATPVGASTRNAGFACFGSPSELLNDARLMGEEKMWRVASMRYKGIQKLRKVLGDEAIGYENSGGYECFNSMKLDEWEQVEAGLQMLNKGLRQITGEQNSFFIADEKLASKGLNGFDHLVENRLEGALHSGKLVRSLIAKVQHTGVSIMNGLEVENYQVSNESILVEARSAMGVQPIMLRTQKMVFATNAFLSRQFPQLGVKPARGQIILSPPIKNLPLSGTFHFDSGYYYFRNFGDRILLGGARNRAFEAEETLDLGNTSIITQALFHFIQLHIPAARDLPLERYEQWSGTMAMHVSKQPLLQQVEPGVWAAMCCNGMGVALSPVFAEQVANAVDAG